MVMQQLTSRITKGVHAHAVHCGVPGSLQPLIVDPHHQSPQLHAQINVLQAQAVYCAAQCSQLSKSHVAHAAGSWAGPGSCKIR